MAILLKNLLRALSSHTTRLSNRKNCASRRWQRVEALERRQLLSATVTNTSFQSTGSVAAGTTSLTITFSTTVSGADEATNYELRAAGSDGVIGTSDDSQVAIQAGNVQHNSATKTTTVSGLTLPENAYRLTVKDQIFDSSGEFLDGDNNLFQGGNFVGEFIVGSSVKTVALSTTDVAGLTNVTKVAAGIGHYLALKSDGTVWAWGTNSLGQLGDGSTTTRSTPIQVPGLSNVVSIAAGPDESFAIMNDGTAKIWGRNAQGLNNGSGVVASWSTPTTITGLGNVQQISSLPTDTSASDNHVLVLLKDGTVKGWGNAQVGKLGALTGTISVPTAISGLSNITAVSAGDHHSLALRSDGVVFAFGVSSLGELGLGSGVTVATTPTVISGLSGVTSIAAGQTHSLATRGDGALFGWGSNNVRQFGPSPLLSQYSTPVIVPTSVGVRSVGAGNENSTELLTNGTVYRTGTGTGQSIVAGLNSVTTAVSGTYTAIVLRSPSSQKVSVEFESATSSGREGTTDSLKLLVKGTVTTPQTIEVIKSAGAVTPPDYSVGTISIPAGTYDGTSATAITIPIQLLADVPIEDDETLTLALAHPTTELSIGDANASSTTQPTHILTILEQIPPTVTSTSFLAAGTLPANSTSLNVTFSESVVGANTNSNYELRRAGADGLLGNVDDVIVSISSVTMSGTIATLNFSALPEDVYRLTVKDVITDVTGNALDGDGSGAAGGDWRKDFVVGAWTASLTSPNGLMFDPEIGGFGAGQLVQGTANAFDGLGRLKVGTTDFIGGVPSPLLLTTTMSSNSTVTLTGAATVPFNQLVSTATGAPAANVSTSEQTVGTNGEYAIAARVSLQSVTTNRAVVLSIAKNGQIVSSKIHQFVANPSFSFETVDISDRLNLVAGDKISINLNTLGANSTLYSGSPYAAFFHVSKIADVPGSGSAVPTTTMSSNSTVTLTGAATVPFNQLVSTATGAPAANVSTSEQTVDTNGEYAIAARVSLQSVTTNRAVVLSIAKNGQIVSSKIHQFVANPSFSFETVDISDRLNLVAGDKISINLNTLGANSTLYSGSPYAAFFHVSKIADVPGSGSAVPTTTMSSNSTVTLTGAATVPFNQLVSTATGAPAANVSTSEQTVGTNGEYAIAARVSLQSVTTNRAVVLSIAKNGQIVSSKIHQFVANPSFSFETVDISDRLNLVAGDKISINLNTLGANSTLYSGSPYAAFFHVSKIADVPNATLLNSGRTIRTDFQSVASLTVSREVTDPANGLYDFARTVDTFTNSTGSAITAPIRVLGNLGSDAATAVFATSDGDLLVEPTDLWVGTDDGDGNGTPAIITLLHGPYGLQPTSVNVIEDNVEWTYNLTLAAGETKRLASFTVLGTTRAEAIAAANALVTTNGFGGEAAAFLTTQELASLANFQFNTAPTDITISSNAIAENAGTNAGIGTLSFSDANPGDTGVYSLPLGLSNNGLFNIAPDGVTLRANNSFNFEATNAYSVTVRVIDAGGLSFDKVIAINVNNVNEAPTALNLSSTTSAENNLANAVIGSFSSSDPDAGDTFTYSLVTGTGSTDNAAFTISGSQLKANAPFDFESQNSYSVRVRTSDAGGLTFEQIFTITVTNVNETPTALNLSSATIAENNLANAVIGTFSSTDPDAGDTFTYSLVTGTGSTDNGAFSISGSQLKANASFDYETKNSYSIRIRTTDAGGLSFEQIFTITVTNVDDAPTALNLSSTTIAENNLANAAIGTFSSTDPDAGDTFTYSLVTGAGSTDNAAFTISGGQLKGNASFDFETKNSYSIRVRTTDAGGLTFEQVFTITVTNQNEAPTSLNLSFASIAENNLANAVIGTFSSTDPDAGDTFTYSLVTGSGSTDNAAFTISGIQLKANAPFDFEGQNSYSIRVRTTDAGGLTFEQIFTITVTNVNETPTALNLSSATIAENNLANAVIGTFSSTDPDAGDTFTYSLVTGTGSTDNAAFTIIGSQLKANAPFDFETQNSYSIRVRTTDAGGLTFEQIFTIAVTNVNEAPTALNLSSTSLAENNLPDAVVGTFSTVDPDASDSFTYTLVTGAGDSDNTAFTIDGDVLKTNVAFNFETKDTYSLRVSSTDQSGLSFERVFMIFVTDVNERPVFDQSDYSFAAPENSLPNLLGNGYSNVSSASADGRYVAFVSFASNLVVGDTNGTWDVFLKDLQTGTISLVSVSETGVLGNYSSDDVRISANGRFVVFSSIAVNLVADDTNNCRDIFVKDLQTGTLTLVSANTFGVQGDNDSSFPNISDDGRYVTFGSSASNLVEGVGGHLNVFRKDVQTGEISLVSADSSGMQGNGLSFPAQDRAISADGRFVCFESLSTNLVAGNTMGRLQVYVKDLQSGEITLVSADSTGSPGNHHSSAGSISANGRTVIFTSRAYNLVPEASFERSRIYEADLQTGKLTLITQNTDYDESSPSFSADGRYVAFSSTDANGNFGSFVRDRQTGTVIVASTNDAGELGNSHSQPPQISADGRYVYFSNTSTNLVAGDTNDTSDVFVKDLQTGMVTLISGNIHAAGSIYATDPDAGTSLTYSLSGPGSSDFVIDPATGAITVAAGANLDFESKATYVLTATVTDGLLSTTVPVTINLSNVNEAPTALELSSTAIAENNLANAVIGSFSSTDPDAGDTFTYSLVTGTGSTDNAAFSISGSQLKANASFDFETQNSYSIRVRTTDAGGLSFEQIFTITVTNVNESPTALNLSSTAIAENNLANAVIGAFSSVDPDAGDTFTYSLITGTGSTDNSAFSISGGQLRADAPFDFETKNSYSIRVRTTDAGGLSFEQVFTINVTDVVEDVTAPTSLIAALPAASTSLAIPITASGSDPGTGASGVKEYDLYYSTGGAFTKFATVPANSPTTTFTGSANTTYWFRSLGRDNAGNVETKITSDTFTRIGDIVPPATQVTTAVPNSTGLFAVSLTGTKASGSALAQFDVYVSVDGAAAVLVGTANANAVGGGVYSASVSYQGLADGTSHTYAFFSRGRDGAGNIEAAPATADVTVTYSFSAQPFSATGIDVQNGASERSYVRYLDVLFSSASGLTAWPTTGRVAVERFAIDAASTTAGTGTPVTGANITKDGSKLKLDFGSLGLGGLNVAGNGFYRVRLDIDGNGFGDAGDKAFEFHRLFGDSTGDGKVDQADTDVVNSQLGRAGSNLNGDVDGNGVVNTTDRLFSTQQRGKKLMDYMLSFLDD